MSRYIFFLGGYDAEMVEIKNILQSARERLFDKSLSWGAALSSYEEEIAKVPSDIIPVFIELKADCSYPENSEFIDHHGEGAGKDKKTSIEQIAEMLGIELNRYQKLISANDRGHIRGMKELCPTDKEITEIRAMDRKAQGVAEEDERLAEESIERHLQRIADNAVIVSSLTNKTSPVFDRLYDKYNHIFVFTPDGEMNYSGSGEMVCHLVRKYEWKKKEDLSIEFWYGGDLPDYGFFGTKTPLAKKEIQDMINDYEKRIISQHIFMFPFRIENPQPPYTLDLWEKKPFDPSLNGLNYSEFSYFHEYVRKVIYELGDDNEKWISRYYELKGVTLNNSTMELHISGRTKPFILQVDNISLRIFETDVGILSFSLFNHKYENLNEILLINEFGRRVYPQFLPKNGDIGIVKGKFLADKIIFKLTGIKTIEEDFSCLSGFYDKDQKNIRLGRHITELLQGLDIVPIIDDRMFTVCWYGNDCWSNKLKNNGYKSSDEWYSFIFIDGKIKDIGCANEDMKVSLIKDNTYARWSDYGTIYGVTRYSLMCLTEAMKPDNIFPGLTKDHMQTMYYQIAIILLAQRASILKFSDDVSSISAEIESFIDKKTDDFEKIAERVRKLHASFIRFVNRLWFTEVTPQEQGIEMYQMAVRNMGLTKQLDELRFEIKELYEFVEMEYEKIRAEEDREINKTLSRLTWLAVIFMPLTLAAGLLGMNLFASSDIPKIVEFINEFLRINLSNIRLFYQVALIFIITLLPLYVPVVYLLLKKQSHKRE
ncbi:MAG TPA: hypothetical protein ENN18_03020 [Proteobacteria bacterium]|nr:hypothetical protein [Pseudomonadota bacterium]